MNPEQQLLAYYQQNPSRTLPNAYWKTALQMSYAVLEVQTAPDGTLSALSVWHDRSLLAFWCHNAARHPLSPEQVERTAFALVHADGLPMFHQGQFEHRRAYFRLAHTGEPPDFGCPPGFAYQEFDPTGDVLQAVDLIKTCYQDMNVTENIVRGWFEHPVYAPELWVWIVDKTTGQKVGLGIGEFDPRVPEASLEWIQVLPTYQGHGIGKAIVAELLRRVKGKVAFTTVSGEVENITKPEKLYRICGFTGQDIWWMLTNRPA